MPLKNIWLQGWLLWAPVFKRTWAWVVFGIIVSQILDYSVGSIRGYDERYFLSAACFALAIELLFSVITMIFVNQASYDVRNKSYTPLLESLTNNFKHILIETTRALVPILLRTVLLIVPGIIESVRLYFIPYICQFDAEYKAGKVDALERSRELTRTRFWALFGILILDLALSILPKVWLRSVVFTERTFLFVMVSFLALVCEIYSYTVMFSVYEYYVSIRRRNGN